MDEVKQILAARQTLGYQRFLTREELKTMLTSCDDF